jgi:hypothetical protein
MKKTAFSPGVFPRTHTNWHHSESIQFYFSKEERGAIQPRFPPFNVK